MSYLTLFSPFPFQFPLVSQQTLSASPSKYMQNWGCFTSLSSSSVCPCSSMALSYSSYNYSLKGKLVHVTIQLKILQGPPPLSHSVTAMKTWPTQLWQLGLSLTWPESPLLIWFPLSLLFSAILLLLHSRHAPFPQPFSMFFICLEHSFLRVFIPLAKSLSHCHLLREACPGNLIKSSFPWGE